MRLERGSARSAAPLGTAHKEVIKPFPRRFKQGNVSLDGLLVYQLAPINGTIPDTGQSQVGLPHLLLCQFSLSAPGHKLKSSAEKNASIRTYPCDPGPSHLFSHQSTRAIQNGTIRTGRDCTREGTVKRRWNRHVSAAGSGINAAMAVFQQCSNHILG